MEALDAASAMASASLSAMANGPGMAVPAAVPIATSIQPLPLSQAQAVLPIVAASQLAHSAEATVLATTSPNGLQETSPSGQLKKHAWTPEEDAILQRIVSQEGAKSWTKVAAHLPHRMGRQCRERWFNHLAPEVKKGYWTAEEDHLIINAVREHGTKWSTIQKLLPGRSDNSIKNRYYSAIRKFRRLQRRSSGGEGELEGVGDAEEWSPARAAAARAAAARVAGADSSAPSALPVAGAHPAGGRAAPTSAMTSAAIGIDMRHWSHANSAAVGIDMRHTDPLRHEVAARRQPAERRAGAPATTAVVAVSVVAELSHTGGAAAASSARGDGPSDGIRDDARDGNEREGNARDDNARDGDARDGDARDGDATRRRAHDGDIDSDGPHPAATLVEPC